MGKIVDAHQLKSLQDLYRLVVFTDHTYVGTAISINKLLAEELLKLKPRRRTMQMEACLNRVLAGFPEKCVIKDFDVMFNPEYKIDIMRLLIEQNKRHSFSVVWPGRYENGKLIYGEEQFSDYRVYNINDYDILCVI